MKAPEKHKPAPTPISITDIPVRINIKTAKIEN